jgi:hypothetical protein
MNEYAMAIIGVMSGVVNRPGQPRPAIPGTVGKMAAGDGREPV